VTALSKLFRTTAFRLSLTYLALFSAAAIVAMFYIYWNTTVLLQRQCACSAHAATAQEPQQSDEFRQSASDGCTNHDDELAS
jgi:hypothetical protein